MSLPDVDISMKDSSQSEYTDFKGKVDFFYKNDDNETVGHIIIDAKMIVKLLKDHFFKNK